ncbi:MAG: MFS transporter [Rhodoferax sp.]|nr:MFS transporter [Rhodoferax sp.]
MSDTQWPRSATAWAMVLLLTLAYVFSFVDRGILGLLIEPIKADIHLTDEQIGYLIGPAFALFYATMGLPLGWLADRKRRTWIVATGVALWSFATAASGLASSVWHLVAARMGVGIGEATLSPCAMSMIADSFPPERRGKPVAVYAAALSLGAGIASLIGAVVLTWAKTSSGIVLPLFGSLRPWQFAFLVVGLPGLLIALAFLFVPEPLRRGAIAEPAIERAGLRETLRYVARHAGAFVGLSSLVCVMTIVAYSHGFLASAFVRKFHWEARDYALIHGLMLLAIGPASVTLTGVLCDRWRNAGQTDAPFRLLSIGFVLMLLTSALALLMPTPVATLVLLGLSTVGAAIVTATGIISLLDITPAAIRGQVVALYYMVISITGLGLGPTTVGWLSTRVFGEGSLHLAISAVPVIYGLVPLLLIPAIRRLYLQRLALLS